MGLLPVAQVKPRTRITSYNVCYTKLLRALSHHPRYAHDETAYTHACWKMLPEVRAFAPRGIGVVPYCMPGSKLMAEATTEKLRRYDVAVWET